MTDSRQAVERAQAQTCAERIIRADENMPTEQGVPLGWVNPDALLLARAYLALASALADTERELAQEQRMHDENCRALSAYEQRWRHQCSRAEAAEAHVAELEAKLRSAYAYRETMEGLPPGTLTDKLTVGSR